MTKQFNLGDVLTGRISLVEYAACCLADEPDPDVFDLGTSLDMNDTFDSIIVCVDTSTAGFCEGNRYGAFRRVQSIGMMVVAVELRLCYIAVKLARLGSALINSSNGHRGWINPDLDVANGGL